MTVSYESLFVMDRKGLISQLTNGTEPRNQENSCYLAVLYGVNGDLKNMQLELENIVENDISSPNILSVYHEAKIIEAYYQRNFPLARNLAETELLSNRGALWAEYVLATLNEREKQPAKAIQNYKNILSVFPTHSDSLLGICRVIVMSNGSMAEAKKYLGSAEPSYTKSLYGFLLPFLDPGFLRLFTFFLLLGLFLIPTLGTIVFFLLIAFVISFQVWTLFRNKLDFLVLQWTFVNLGSIIIVWVVRTIIMLIVG